MPAPIDLSKVPLPAVVQQLSFEDLVRAWKDQARADNPDLDGLDVESDPTAKWTRTGAFREGLLRQRINDAAEACMLTRAKGADLDNLVAIYNIRRAVVTPADPDANPPVEQVLESDERLRRRALLFPSSISTAGPESAYRYHTLNASPLVRDVALANPAPGSLTVTVLAESGDGGTGVADANLLAAVASALNEENVRPMGDVLTVQSAVIVEYAITAEVTIGTGPDSATVLAAARASVRKAADSLLMLGRGAPLSALYAALHVEGVTKASLTSPAADVAATAVQAARATSITVNAA